MFLGEDIHEREPAALDERIGDRLAAVLLELGLVVEQLELAGPAGHEQVDHALGPRREMARPGRERIARRAPAVPRDAVARPMAHRRRRWPRRSLAEKRRQGHRAQPDAAVGEEVAPRLRRATRGRACVSWSKSPVMADQPSSAVVATDSLAGHELVEVQEHAGDGRPTPERRPRRVRRAASPARRAPGQDVCERLAARARVGRRPRQSRNAWRSRSRSLAGGGPLAQDPSGQALGDLDEGRVVEQRQRLERRVGSEPARAGLHAAGRVEGRQERMRRGPPEERVEPAAIAVRARCRPATAASSGPGS